MDIGVALATALPAAVDGATPALLSAKLAEPLVFQMASLPLIIDPRRYRNAHSNQNPNGSFVALRAVRDLVNPVPIFSHTYTAGVTSTESCWSALLQGATAVAVDGFAGEALNTARETFAEQALASLDGSPTRWRPVYVSPEDWSAPRDDHAWTPVTIDLTGRPVGDLPYATIGRADADTPANWQVNGPTSVLDERPVHPDSQLHRLTLDVLQVAIQRPWLDAQLLRVNGLELPGQPVGLFSTGRLSHNTGLLPLLPTSFWCARNVNLTAQLAHQDADLLTAPPAGGSISLGGIAVTSHATSGTAARPPTQIVAWISALLPQWPRASHDKAAPSAIPQTESHIPVHRTTPH